MGLYVRLPVRGPHQLSWSRRKMVVLVSVWTIVSWMTWPGRIPTLCRELRVVIGKSRWMPLTTRRQRLQLAMASLNLRWWHLVCVIHRVHSKGLWSSSFLACSGRRAWSTWTMSLFLDGTLRNTWGGSKKSLNSSARQGWSWNPKSVSCYCRKYPIRAVEQWPIPAKVSDVRSFLGLASYYCRFIEDFAEIAAPFYHLIAKSTEGFWWSAECDTAFHTLKRNWWQLQY